MRRLASVLALLLLVLPFGANALGLGDIELLSALNEPLDARISLRAVKEGDIDDLQIRIASRDHFARAGIDRAFVLTSLKFTAREGAAPGTGEIRISTREPMTEPFLNFLLDVDWRQGRVIREYTVLLDPPVYGAAISTTVEKAVTTVDALPELDEPVAEAEVITSTTGTGSTSSTTASGATGGTYGPVKSTDTAWSLAERLRPNSSVTVQQTMLALLNANPNAFARGNINALQQGAVLRIPDSSEINSLSANEALSEVKRQHALWEEYRQSAGASTTQQPAGEADDGATAAGSGESTSTSTTQSGAEEDSSRLDIVSAGSGEVGVGGNSEDVAALQSELTVALEEADIERRENEEMRARLAEADAIISQLQRAVEIKDDDIAALQDELAKTEAELEASKSAMMEVEPEPVPEPEPAPEPAPEPEPVPEPQPTTFMDVVKPFVPLDNPIVLAAAGGGLLLLIILVVVFAKRRRNVSLDEDVPDEALLVDDDAPTEIPMAEDATQLPPMSEEDGGSDPFDEDEDATQLPPAMADTEAAPVAEETEAEEEDDPLEGLNIYLAYEDYDNATKLVKDVISKHPERHEYKARLLEIYYASKNIPAFETTAKELQDAVGEDSPMMDSARRWWDDLSPGRGLFEAPVPREGSFDETQMGGGEAIFDVTDSSGAAFGADDTMEISLDDVEADGDGGGVDFDLGFEFEEAEETELPSTEEGHTLDFEVGAGEEVETPSDPADTGVDFDLDMEAEPTELPVPDPMLDDDTVDFELDVAADAEPTGDEAIGLDIEIPTAQAQASTEDSLDIALDLDDATGADPTELPPPEGSAEGIDFDLDVEPRDVIADADEGLDIALDFDDSPVEAEEKPDAEPEADGLDIEILEEQTTDLSALDGADALDFALDEEESETQGDTQDLEFALDLDSPGAEVGSDADGSSTDEDELDLGTLEEEPSTDSGVDDLDFALDLDAGEEEVADSPPAADDLDISLDLDEPDTGSNDDLDLTLGDELDGESTVVAAESSGDAPTLDFDLDEPLGAEPTADFETVQLKAEDLARVGAIEPDDVTTATLDEGADGVEVDSDFADIFGGESEDEDEISGFEIELPDSALAAEEADVANVEEIDFDLGDDDGESPVPGDSDYERTQYMLRDIANITSDEDDDEDEEDKTLVLGRSGGEVDEIQTKLDLAQAYIDMGDTEGARNILGEVMAEGSEAQQDLARQLLSQLN